HEWLRHLAARGHTVTVTTGWSHHRYHLDGVAVLGWESPGDPADLVICHAGDSRTARRYAAQVGSPLVVVAHGAAEPHQLAGADLVVFVSDAQRGETGWDGPSVVIPPPVDPAQHRTRSEEHTSELQSRENLVCRLLLEKKNKPMNRDKDSVTPDGPIKT